MGDWTGTVPTILAGDIVTGDDWKIITDIDTALVTAWTTWVPTLTNLTLGNGTVTARYRRVGKSVDFYFRFVLGSTSAVGTDPNFSLPATPASHYPVGGEALFPGKVWLLDPGVRHQLGDIRHDSAGVLTFMAWTAINAAAGLTATVPWTWATGDIINTAGTYEAA